MDEKREKAIIMDRGVRKSYYIYRMRTVYTLIYILDKKREHAIIKDKETEQAVL